MIHATKPFNTHFLAGLTSEFRLFDGANSRAELLWSRKSEAAASATRKFKAVLSLRLWRQPGRSGIVGCSKCSVLSEIS